MLKELYGSLNILLHYIYMLGTDEITWKREHAAKSK